VPWHVAKSPSEFYALGGVLGIKCVGIFHEQVGIVYSGFVSTNPETRSNSSAYLSGLAVGASAQRTIISACEVGQTGGIRTNTPCPNCAVIWTISNYQPFKSFIFSIPNWKRICL
jgi:hypothetical protein